MPDSYSWDELARQFENLDPDDWLVLAWTRFAPSGKIEFGFASRRGNPYTEEEPDDATVRLMGSKYRIPGVRAGKKFNAPGDPYREWLFAVVRHEDPSALLAGSHGRVYNLCKISAALCYRLLADEESPRSSIKQNAQPVPSHPQGSESIPSASGDIIEERQRLILEYKSICKKAGVRVTDAMIAKAASPSWNDRTQVTWWKRKDPQSTPAADRCIRAVFTAKPHLPKK